MRLDKMLTKERERRHKRVRIMLGKGWGPTKIGDALRVTRQRAQQIIKQVNGGSE